MMYYRIVEVENGWYKIQHSDDKKVWYSLYNSSLLFFFLEEGCETLHMFLWLAKRKVDRLVKEQERKLARESGLTS